MVTLCLANFSIINSLEKKKKRTNKRSGEEKMLHIVHTGLDVLRFLSQ